MSSSRIYTRVFSQSSAGELVCGKGFNGSPLSRSQLLNEFRSHANKDNRNPTALVSVSNRLIDTVKRAFEKYYHDDESSAKIWIAFIQIPTNENENPARVHAGRDLAEACGLPTPQLFYHESVFEWNIPKNYLLHKVSLKTLMDRGLDWERYFVDLTYLSTAEICRHLSSDLRPRQGAWEIGIHLGSFARCFGAKAPVDWVARHYFHDCVRARILDDDIVSLKYANEDSEIVDFEFFCEMDCGIETALVDWWFQDDQFLQNYMDFKEWRDEMEDIMAEDEIEFWETWYIDDNDGAEWPLSGQEKLAYDKARIDLLARRERIMTLIDVKAVNLGL